MLHAIDEQGNISWHCTNPECQYHNCQGWDREINCVHHAEAQRNQDAGQTHTAHISNDEIKWTGPKVIALPRCSECGGQTFVHVHDDEELTPPIVTRDEQTNEILQVAPANHPKFSGNLWIVDADTIKKLVKHPSVEHLSVGQIQQLQSDIKEKAPNLPMDGLLTEITTQKINKVYQHPAVDRHRSLAEQMKASGKVYTPPVPEPVQTSQPTFTLDQVQDLITKTLQEHGVITSPRLPAISPVATQPPLTDQLTS